MLVDLIANAFEVAVDLDDGEDEAKVDGHGLLFGEQIVGHVVDRGFGRVDGRLDLKDVVAERHVGGKVSLNRELKSLLRERGHGKQLVFQGHQLLLKVDTRQTALL